MAKKALLVVFSIECVVLAILLCREWTLHYIGGGHAESEYQSVYRDRIEAGHHPVTAEIDAGTTSFVVWWGGVVCLFVGVAFGGPCWAYQQLWPARTIHAALAADPFWESPEAWNDADEVNRADLTDADDLFGDQYEVLRAR
jgi:hypothetical protein